MADFDWLPEAQVLDWLKLNPQSRPENLAAADLCRQAAADWVQDQRGDLWADVVDEITGEVTGREFKATPRVVQAGVLATARLYARVGSAAGIASYAEIGATAILSYDPDVERLLGIGRHAKPAVG